MPETGFSLRRIRAHLRKWIGLYLVGMIAVCFLNHIVYTVTRPGFSDDETLRIMLMNVETVIGDEDYEELSMKLLPEIQKADAGIQIIEFEQIPFITPEDPTSNMLLQIKLTGGFGDIYLTDEAGLELLRGKQALAEDGVAHLRKCVLTGSEAYLAIISNTTDMESAHAALPVLAAALEE